MLVLSRYRDEVIVVGEGENEIRIIIVDIRGDRVRVGIDAHRDIPVHRLEVREAIDQERREASEASVLLGLHDAIDPPPLRRKLPPMNGGSGGDPS